MNEFRYEFTESDVKTLICTLNVYQQMDFDETIVDDFQNDINICFCMSTIEKLMNNRTDIEPNEFKMMYVSLLLANEINNGNIQASPEIKTLCAQHIFGINKLFPIFDEFVSKIRK